MVGLIVYLMTGMVGLIVYLMTDYYLFVQSYLIKLGKLALKHLFCFIFLV